MVKLKPLKRRGRRLRSLLHALRFLLRERPALFVEAILDFGDDTVRSLGSRFLPSLIPARRTTGAWGEARAARYLRRRGLRIVERNYRVRSGEVDLIALEERTLVFVEVKTVRATSRVWGLDRINPSKERRITRAIDSYLARRRPDVDRWRVDAVVVEYEPGWRGRRRLRGIFWYPAFFEV